jgi:hypothetical protein
MRLKMKARVNKTIDDIFNDKHVTIEDPKMARILGRELKRLGLRERVFIGRDDSYGITVVALIGGKGRKKKFGIF